MAAQNSFEVRAQLVAEFGDTPGFNDAFVDQCITVCNNYHISGQDLFYKWEASLVGDLPRMIHDKTVANIVSVVKSDLERAERQKKPRTNPAMVLRGRQRIPFLNKASRPGQKVGLIPADIPSEALESTSTGAIKRSGSVRVAFKMEQRTNNRRLYKYMYEKVSERSAVLDERIEEFAELIRIHYDIADLGDPSAATEEDVVVVGRIVLDAESISSGSVKLNEASLHLESSRLMGSGYRVPIRFETNVKLRGAPKGQGGIGLYPGAIVALKGKNGGGGWFSVQEFLSMPSPPPSQSPSSNSVKFEPRDSSFSMAIAAGPYTADADLRFKPWLAFLERIKAQKPDVILLIGPFIDRSHPKMMSGEVDQYPEDVFQEIFIKNLNDFLDISPHTLVLLLPSVRDIISNHAVYPQAELNIDPLQETNIKMVPNPGRFSVNGVSFAVTSVDILWHLKREELLRSAEELDGSTTSGDISTTARYCRHLLSQRSFYPIFPTPHDLAHEVNLDVSHLDGLSLCPGDSPAVAPDVLVTPCRLKDFAKVVDHTLAINPASLTKNTSANLFFGGEGEGPIITRLKAELHKLQSE